jgi:hypothetical protein
VEKPRKGRLFQTKAQSTAYGMGANAFHGGAEASANPYPLDSPEYDEWWQGWSEAPSKATFIPAEGGSNRLGSTAGPRDAGSPYSGRRRDLRTRGND